MILILVDESASESEESTREVPEKWSRRRRQKPKDDLQQLSQVDGPNQLDEAVVSPRPVEPENAGEAARIIQNPETVEETQASGFPHTVADHSQSDTGLADKQRDGSGPLKNPSLSDEQNAREPQIQPASDDNYDRNSARAAIVTASEVKSKTRESAAQNQYDADRKRYLQENDEKLGEFQGSLGEWAEFYAKSQAKIKEKNEGKRIAPEESARGSIGNTKEPPLPPDPKYRRRRTSQDSEDSLELYADITDVRKAPLPPDMDDELEEVSVKDRPTGLRISSTHTGSSQQTGQSSRLGDDHGLPTSDSGDTAGRPKSNGTAPGSQREAFRQPQSEMASDTSASVPLIDATRTKGEPTNRSKQEVPQKEDRPLPETDGNEAKNRPIEQPAQSKRKSDGILADGSRQRLESARQLRADQAGVEYPEPRKNVNPDTGLSKDRPAGPLTTDESLKVIASAWEQEQTEKLKNPTPKGPKSDKYKFHKMDITMATQGLEDRTGDTDVDDRPETTKPSQKPSKVSDQVWQAHHSDEDTDFEVEGMRMTPTELTCR